MRTFDYYCPCCNRYFEKTIGSDENLHHQKCNKCGAPVRQVWITAPQMNVAFMPKRNQSVAGTYDPRYVDQPEDRDARKERLWYLNQWKRTNTGGLSDEEYVYLKKDIERELELEPKLPWEEPKVVNE
ncbi:hypothetical protein HWQ67_05785 [Candidatus Magnetobacterium casensis]|uniref:Uncharacterized protein n=2 Tax=Candidatus Magnetobacterium casense TaxID=1455061 RepID=A0ABS6RWU0_9BACT|nr:hypothetical protein [Candidatus Magnetobacterium casensis]